MPEQPAATGAGVQSYHTGCGAFPPAINLPAGEIEATTSKWKENWVITILPMMDQQPLHDRFDLGKPISDPANRIPRGQKLPLMLCPTDTGSDVLYDNALEGDNWRGAITRPTGAGRERVGNADRPPAGHSPRLCPKRHQLVPALGPRRDGV